MKRESWVTGGLVGLMVLLALFLFVIWRPIFLRQGISGNGKIAVKVGQGLTGKEASDSAEPSTALGKLIQDAEMPKGLEFKPFFEKEEQNIKDTFLERFAALVGRQFLSQFESQSGFNSLPAGPSSSQNIPTEVPKHNLTDEKWFNLAYPDYYLKYLQSLQKIMIEKGFLSASDAVVFKEEKVINPFLHKVVDFALEEKVFTEAQAKNAKYGIDVVLPMLQKDERIQWSQQLGVLLMDIFKTKTASAQVVDCFRSGVSTGVGFNGFAICCNCGWGYYGETLIYFEDCTELSSVVCNTYEMGCKNSVCEMPKPMIWDPTTMICGCG